VIELTTLSGPELAITCVAITLAYTVFGFGGFGANLVALPILAHVMTIRFAVPMLLVLDLASATLMGVKNRPLIDRGELKRLVPTLLLGMLLGLVVLQVRGRALAAGGAGAVRRRLRAVQPVRPPRPAPGLAALGLAGRAGGRRVQQPVRHRGAGVHAVPGSSHRRHRPAARHHRRPDPGLGRWCVWRCSRASGFLAQPGLLPLALLLVPCALAGYLIGSRLHARLPQAQVRRAIWLLLLASAAGLLARGLSTG
jgi:hypothetical protein